MASSKQNKDFINSLNFSLLLDDAIDYIKDNFNPEQIFEDSALATWAIEHGFVDEYDNKNV